MNGTPKNVELHSLMIILPEYEGNCDRRSNTHTFLHKFTFILLLLILFIYGALELLLCKHLF